MKSLFGALLPVDLVVGLYPAPLLAASGFGLLAAAAFALWPLGQVERTPVTALFRADAAESVRRPTLALYYRHWILLYRSGGIGHDDFRASRCRPMVRHWCGRRLFCAARCGGAFGLAGENGSGGPRRPELRMALANMTRPQAPVRAVMLSIGLSVTLLSAISMVDGNINEQISGDLPERTPSFFLLDIGPQQIDDVLRVAERLPSAGMIEQAAMLRGQVLSLKGIAAADYNASPRPLGCCAAIAA